MSDVHSTENDVPVSDTPRDFRLSAILDTQKKLARRRKFDAYLRWFRTCAVCHACCPPIDLVCRACWDRLGEIRNRTDVLIDSDTPFAVRALWTWTPDTEAFARPLITGFKGGLNVRASERFAELLSLEGHDGTNVSQPVFVFPPSSNESRDHAWTLAQTLAKRWQTAALGLERLEGDTGSAQKSRSASERSLRRYRPLFDSVFEFDGMRKPSANSSRPDLEWVFVDDVITTGSTAMAAYMALGEPESFTVWSLVSRPKLAK